MENKYPITAEYAEVFGIEMPEEAPTEPTTKPAEPTAQTEPKEPETQDPPAEEPKEQRGPMDPKERSEWAARRRKWEAQEREQAARETAMQARIDQVYAEIFAGQTNPVTGKPIQTEADYKAVLEARQKQQQNETLQKAGIDPQTIQDIVNREMAPIRQKMETAELAAIQERAKAANARMEAALNAQLKKITAMDPAIKTLDDIRAMPTANRFNDLVQKGVGLEDAFYLANRQSIEERRIAAARTAMQEQAAGKSHLNPVGSTGKTVFEVTAEQIRAYREFMPNATEEEIRKAYEREYKK